MLVCAFSHNFAHETAGAARTRHPLRPRSWAKRFAKPGRNAPRECGGVFDEYERATSSVVIAGLPGRPSIPKASAMEPRSRGDRDRGKPCGFSPPTPPYVRVTYTAVRWIMWWRDL